MGEVRSGQKVLDKGSVRGYTCYIERGLTMEPESFELVGELIEEAKAEGSAVAHATIELNFLESVGSESRVVLLKDVVEITDANISYLNLEGETINVPMDDIATLIISTADPDDVELDV